MASKISKIASLLKVVWPTIRFNLEAARAWILWASPFECFNIFFSFLSWYYFGGMFGHRPAILEPYGGDFASYLIIGLMFNSFLSYTLTAYLGLTRRLYAPDTVQTPGVRLSHLDYCRLAGIPISLWMASEVLYAYICQTVYFLAYLAFGVFIFNIPIHGGGYGIALLALLLGILAVTAISLISASFALLVGHPWGRDPISWVIGLFASLTSGVYFPPELLPSWLQSISYCLPQTYSLKIGRLALLGNIAFFDLLPELSMLTAICLILLPISALIFKLSLDYSIRRGPRL